MRAWLTKNCTWLWRTIFAAGLGLIFASIWQGSIKLGELVIALDRVPAAIERLEDTVRNHEGRILVLEALRNSDRTRATP